MASEIHKLYGNRARLRVCGICLLENKLLLVNHKMSSKGDFWAPPGGGLEFGHSLEQTLKREFQEETGIEIQVGRFLFGCEFIDPPLHAVELFFSTEYVSGQVRKGQDPELDIITDVALLDWSAISVIPSGNLHGLFRHITALNDLFRLSGFYRI